MSVPIDAVEVAARAAHELLEPELWEDLTESARNEYRTEARTALMTLHPEWRPAA